MRDVDADKMTVAKVLARFDSLPLNTIYYALLMLVPHFVAFSQVGLPALLSVPLTAACILRVNAEEKAKNISAQLPEMTAKA